MPQMAPANWLLIFTISMMSLMLLLATLHFYLEVQASERKHSQSGPALNVSDLMK